LQKRQNIVIFVHKTVSIHPPIHLQHFVGLWPLFQFLNLNTVGRAPLIGEQPVARPQPTHRTTQTQNKCTETFMP
jgi:hypothetical protein